MFNPYSSSLTGEEWRSLGIATLTAAATTAAAGLVTWCIEEAKRRVQTSRDARQKESTSLTT